MGAPVNDVSTEVTRRFAANMRRLRNELGLSAQDMADRLAEAGIPISRPVLANLETARRDSIDLAEAYAIARVLGTTVDFLSELSGIRCVQCQDTPPDGYRCLVCNRKGGDLS